MSGLLRDDPDFGIAVVNAAERLGLDPGFVEKDYWVTQVLRELARSYAASIVFKGGTSLSKGYGIIERFSEDVDILLRPMHGATVRQAEVRLLQITEHVAGALGVRWEPKRNPSRGKHASRADVLRYPATIVPSVDVTTERDGVLLESGYGDGREPASTVVITPLLCAPLEMDPAEHPDTAPFEIAALHPIRTLLEKVLLLHQVASRFESGDVNSRDERIGRHYYDVDRLLAHGPTLRHLRERREECLALLADIEKISESQYGGMSRRPDAGYGAGPAFAPARESELHEWLTARYDAAAALMPHASPAEWPSFERVLRRISQHADLL